jgi:hypothetical protein
VEDLISAKGTKSDSTMEKTYRVDVDGRRSEVEELVGTRNDNGPNQTDNPRAESRRKHRGIVGVGDRGPDFGIWGFIVNYEGREVNIGVVVIVDGVQVVLCTFG